MSGAVLSNPPRLGRFELKRLLGRGAQAAVWLGYDARLDREVAVKLINRGADDASVAQWLHEARAVSRLTHPHIVPVFEADEQAGQPYLVFEYVSGPTLSQLLRQRGALPAREAVTLLLGVLDALRVAHESGIVHRDLKPSNILVDAAGRARVMDFGIAARASDGHDNRICGTPGYMSPEAARGQAPSPAMDVFAAGMMLGEMLTGTPLLRERDPFRALERVQDEDMRLPEGGPAIDDALRAVVMRAIARDLSVRHADAASLHAELGRWLQPPAQGDAAAGAGGSATLEFLLRRMRHRSDFPALSDSMTRIQRATASENENLSSLSSEILKDVALTNKLLRLVNTAHYSASGGAVSTVSRAVALVGFSGIRKMALSLVLLEHMQDKGHAQQLKEDFLRSLMAGTLASELAGGTREGEEAFLAAMMHNLGRLLAEFYLPEDAEQIRHLVHPPVRAPDAPPPPDEASASRQVLGIDFEELGVGVARSWGLPDSLQKAMRKPVGEPPARPAQTAQGDRLRWLAHAANEVAAAMLGSEDSALRVAEIGKRYAKVLGVSADTLKSVAEQSQRQLSELAQAMNLEVGRDQRARRLLAPEADTEPFEGHDSLSQHRLQATVVDEPPAAPLRRAIDVPVMDLDLGLPAGATAKAPEPVRVADVLASGIQDITNHMVSDGFRLNEVLRMILETMYRALGFRRVVFCLRDPRSGMLTGRFGLGEDAQAVAARFKVPLRPSPGAAPDLFTAVCLKGADTLIADATQANLASRLPTWFREGVNAPAFLLLPLSMKNAPFGLIYADKAQPGGIALDEKELSMLRTLRNQAVMAFRQTG